MTAINNQVWRDNEVMAYYGSQWLYVNGVMMTQVMTTIGLGLLSEPGYLNELIQQYYVAYYRVIGTFEIISVWCASVTNVTDEKRLVSAWQLT